MKIIIASLMIILVAGAFYLGQLSSQAGGTHSDTSEELFAEPVFASDPSARDSARDNAAETMDALRSANERLEADLAATKARLRDAETAASRYAVMRERLLQGQAISIRFSANDLKVPEALNAILNLEEADRQRLDAAFEEIFVQVRESERNSAVVQEHTDDRVVYQVPATDLQLAEKLGASLEGALSEDDRELVMQAFEGFDDKLDSVREVSLELLKHDNPEMIKYRVEAYEIGERGRRLGGSSSTSSYPKDFPFKVDRWSHLFEIE